MSLERRNPLPVGSYWIDVFGDKITLFDGWRAAFSPIGVKTRVTESFPATDTQPARTWYKFEVTSIEAPWDAKTFGFPTIADSSIQSSADTVQRPDFELDPLDKLSNWASGLTGIATETLKVAIPVLGVGAVLLYLASESSKRKKRR
jgi:hypothetical protein